MAPREPDEAYRSSSVSRYRRAKLSQATRLCRKTFAGTRVLQSNLNACSTDFPHEFSTFVQALLPNQKDAISSLAFEDRYLWSETRIDTEPPSSQFWPLVKLSPPHWFCQSQISLACFPGLGHIHLGVNFKRYRLIRCDDRLDMWSQFDLVTQETTQRCRSRLGDWNGPRGLTVCWRYI